MHNNENEQQEENNNRSQNLIPMYNGTSATCKVFPDTRKKFDTIGNSYDMMLQ